jgi:hypothetical protein
MKIRDNSVEYGSDSTVSLSFYDEFLYDSRHKNLPKFSASTKEASFPLGNINPTSKS